MKSWHKDIEQHIEYWSEQLKHSGLEWWPQYLYHTTNITNAVDILRSGYLYSRNEAIRRGIKFHDSASTDVLEHTSEPHKEYVRLYFRPRTPTHYRNEGIRPQHRRRLNAHCPVPIAFVFDAYKVLSDDRTEFSNGNMGSDYVVFGSRREIFNNIPFKYVYHDGPFNRDYAREIIFHRCAEVLLPIQLELNESLKFIACRSTAERQTLLSILSDDIRRKWEGLIRIGVKGLFERKWVFVEEVVVVGDTIRFRLNPSIGDAGPFDVSFEYHDLVKDIRATINKIVDDMRGVWAVKIRGAVRGIVVLRLDGDLAFKGEMIFDEIPF